jgi:hypothetical protein
MSRATVLAVTTRNSNNRGGEAVPTMRVGSSKKYAANWAHAFGRKQASSEGPSKAAKQASAASPKKKAKVRKG